MGTSNAGTVTGALWRRCSEPHTTENESGLIRFEREMGTLTCVHRLKVYLYLTWRCWVVIFLGNILMVLPIRIDKNFFFFFFLSVIKQQGTVFQNCTCVCWLFLDEWILCSMLSEPWHVWHDIRRSRHIWPHRCLCNHLYCVNMK